MQQYGLRWRAYSLRRVIKGWLEVVKESRWVWHTTTQTP